MKNDLGWDEQPSLKRKDASSVNDAYKKLQEKDPKFAAFVAKGREYAVKRMGYVPHYKRVTINKFDK